MVNLTTTVRYGGVETFVWEISRQLAQRGEVVHILGGRGRISQDLPGVTKMQFPFWPRNLVPNLGTRFRKLMERWSFGAFALPTLLRGKYDIVHIHKPFDLPLGVLAKAKGTKLIFGSHGTDFFWGDRIFAWQSDAVVSCSHFNGKEIERRYRIKPVIIYNGIDPEIFRPLPPHREINKIWNLNGAEKILVYAGRLVGWKGVGDLIRAVALLKEYFPVKVMIIGDGEARSSLQKLSHELGIEKKVHFAGFIPNRDLPRYFSIADLAVFPSLADETFGISICEAMACGLPVISTKVGGIPEVVQDEVTGFLILPGDPRILAEKIHLLLKNDSLAKKMGEAGRRRVLENFTWEKVADRLMAVYTDGKLQAKISSNP